MEKSRKNLAVIRTTMANERTLLSYYRASLAMVGLAAFIFKFYFHLVTNILSASCLATAVAIAIFGTWKFRRKRAKIEALKEHDG